MRDEGRCSFTDADGNRCEERCFLEIEHLHPFALNGETSASNCTLRCRCHNTLAAELSFGRDQIAAAIARARERRRSGESRRGESIACEHRRSVESSVRDARTGESIAREQ
jgi:hypothetical protein